MQIVTNNINVDSQIDIQQLPTLKGELQRQLRLRPTARSSVLPLPFSATDEDYASVHPSARRKVPGFDHLLSPVLGITGDHDSIKGFKFDVAIPLSETFQVYQSW